MIQIQEIITNPDQTHNLIIELKGRTIRLNSSRPLAEADKIFSQLNMSSPAFFLGGLGFGYLLQKILDNSQAMCLVYEPESPILDTVLQLRPEVQSLLSDPRVILVRNLQDLSQAIQDHKLVNLSFTINRSYSELFSEEFSQIKDNISASIRKQEVGNATLLRFGKIWTKNLFRNMHRYFKSQKLLPYIGWAKQKPAIIVGAGPSLAESLDLLKQHQNNAIIIACDTALPILYHHKISPDFVVTVDPQEKNSLYLRYTPDKNHFLIADPSVHDSTFENYEKIILMDCVFPLYKPFEHFWGACGLLASGGSVSTSAFDFARKIQADPIIMVGQDLSFTQNKTHSNGNVLTEFSRTTHHRLESFHQRQALTTHTLHTEHLKARKPNQTVPADARLILFRDWFSQEIPKTDANVIVAGLDGAYLEGATHLDIEEAFEILSSTIDKNPPHQFNRISSKDYEHFLKEILTITASLTPKCQQIVATLNKASQTNNLDLAITESTKLQNLLSNNINKKISLLIAISIQDVIQAGLDLNTKLSPKEQIDLLLHISTETLQGIKQLNRYVQKSSLFISAQSK